MRSLLSGNYQANEYGDFDDVCQECKGNRTYESYAYDEWRQRRHSDPEARMEFADSQHCGAKQKLGEAQKYTCNRETNRVSGTSSLAGMIFQPPSRCAGAASASRDFSAASVA